MFGANKRSSWHLFDLFEHPTYVHPAFLILIGLFAIITVNARAGGAFQIVANLLIWAPTLFFGIYLHELGHATALKRFGYGGSDIVLHGFGGVTINRKRTDAPPGRSIVISLAGPFVSFLVAVLGFGAHFLIFGTLEMAAQTGAAMGLLSRFLFIMGVINAVWAVFNMLPVNPLDGGHVVLHALRGKYGNRRKAMLQTAKISLVALGVVVVGSLMTGFLDPFFLLILGGIFAYQNWQILKAGNQRRPPGGRF